MNGQNRNGWTDIQFKTRRAHSSFLRHMYKHTWLYSARKYNLMLSNATIRVRGSKFWSGEKDETMRNQYYQQTVKYID